MNSNTSAIFLLNEQQNPSIDYHAQRKKKKEKQTSKNINSYNKSVRFALFFSFFNPCLLFFFSLFSLSTKSSNKPPHDNAQRRQQYQTQTQPPHFPILPQTTPSSSSRDLQAHPKSHSRLQDAAEGTDTTREGQDDRSSTS